MIINEKKYNSTNYIDLKTPKKLQLNCPWCYKQTNRVGFFAIVNDNIQGGYFPILFRYCVGGNHFFVYCDGQTMFSLQSYTYYQKRPIEVGDKFTTNTNYLGIRSIEII